jgi:hypothetical protein
MFGYDDNHNNLVSYVYDGNFSLTPAEADVFSADIHAPGTAFPTHGLRDRAKICSTNDALYKNDIFRVFNEVLNIIPEREPITGQQIREIAQELPLFSKVEDTYKSLILAKPPIISVDKKYRDFVGTLDVLSLSEKIMQSIMRYGTTAVNVSVKDGKIVATVVPARCLTIYLSDDDFGSVKCYDISNIVDTDSGQQVQFMTYFTDGSVNNSIFEFRGSFIGDELSSENLDSFNACPIVMVTGDAYTEDFYRRMYASACSVIRTFQNFMRLVERLREIIRELPQSALTVAKDGSGSVIARLDGALGINEDTDKDPVRAEYKVPKVPIEQARLAYKTAIEEFANDSMLGLSFFDLEKAGTSLSAKAIEALMIQAKLYASTVQTLIGEGLKRIIQVAIKNSIDADVGVDVRWFDVFNFDTESFVKTVQSRVGSTLTVAQAISILDYVGEDEAAERAVSIVLSGVVAGGEAGDDGDVMELRDSDGVAVKDSNNQVIRVSRGVLKKLQGIPGLFEGWSAPVNIDPKYRWEWVWGGFPPQGVAIPTNGLGGVNGGFKQ